MILTKKICFGIAFFIAIFFVPKTQKIKLMDNEASINLHLPSKDITGSIGGLTTDVFFDPDQLDKCSLKAEFLTETLSTRNKVRDIRLMSKNFLYKKKYKKILFRSTKFIEMHHGYLIEGDLTIKDITKKITLDIIHSEGIIAGATSINLLDYNIGMLEKRNQNKLDVYMNIQILK